MVPPNERELVGLASKKLALFAPNGDTFFDTNIRHLRTGGEGQTHLVLSSLSFVQNNLAPYR